jgi:hypothetical protein
MKAVIQREKIRIKPVPKVEGYQIVVWLKKPLTEKGKPFVYANVEVGRKFYDLPCSIDNINGIRLTYKLA